MSARSHDSCPVCLKREKREAELEVDRVTSHRRALPDDEWRRRMSIALDRVDKPAPQETLAEYYEIGIDRDGKFKVRYHAVCDQCGFTHDFKVEQAVELPQEDEE